MKTIYKYCILFLVLAGMACQKDKDPVEEIDPAEEWGIKIDADIIKSPEWLVHKVDSIGDLYQPGEGGKLYPFVWGTEYDGQKYIYVNDALNASYIRGHLYFSLSGYPVEAMSDLWSELQNTTNSGKLILLWPQKFRPTKSESVSAWTDDVPATIYMPNGTRVREILQ